MRCFAWSANGGEGHLRLELAVKLAPKAVLRPISAHRAERSELAVVTFTEICTHAR